MKEEKNIIEKTTDTLREVTDDIVDSVQKNTDNIVETAQEGVDIVKDEITSAADYTKKNKKRIKEGIFIIIAMLICLSGGIFGTKIATDKKEEKQEKKEISTNEFPLKDLIEESKPYTIEEFAVNINTPNNLDIIIPKHYYIKDEEEIKYILIENVGSIQLQTKDYEDVELISEGYVTETLSNITTKEGTYLIYTEKEDCNYKNMIYNIKTNKKAIISILKTTC